MTTEKTSEQALEEVGEEKYDQDVVETTKDVYVKDGHKGDIEKEAHEVAIVEEELQQDQNVLEIQMLSANPPHVDHASQKNTIKIKEFFYNIVQNINSLIKEYLNKIL